jgi:hypothetical protein
MYAVIKTGGKQYRVAAGEKLKIEQIIPRSPFSRCAVASTTRSTRAIAKTSPKSRSAASPPEPDENQELKHGTQKSRRQFA